MDLTHLIEQGNANPLLILVIALVLGALHGLEPGHSKTMMAAFIIAVRGTVLQAVLLGISAAFSHSIIVWVLGLLALTYGNEMIAEEMEPWFMVASGFIVISIAIWVFWQTWRSRMARNGDSRHNHEHPQNHGHDHSHDHSHSHSHDHHAHDHSHDHHDYLSQDAHAKAHVQDIKKHFSTGQASKGQIIWFGLTGGLIPCPAAVTVLILCLHLQRFWLGVGLVGAFSIGLALTLIAVGVLAAWGVAVTAKKSSRFQALFNKAPYISAILIALLGVIMLISGVSHFNESVVA